MVMLMFCICINNFQYPLTCALFFFWMHVPPFSFPSTLSPPFYVVPFYEWVSRFLTAHQHIIGYYESKDSCYWRDRQTLKRYTDPALHTTQAATKTDTKNGTMPTVKYIFMNNRLQSTLNCSCTLFQQHIWSKIYCADNHTTHANYNCLQH